MHVSSRTLLKEPFPVLKMVLCHLSGQGQATPFERNASPKKCINGLFYVPSEGGVSVEAAGADAAVMTGSPV